MGEWIYLLRGVYLDHTWYTHMFPNLWIAFGDTYSKGRLFAACRGNFTLRQCTIVPAAQEMAILLYKVVVRYHCQVSKYQDHFGVFSIFYFSISNISMHLKTFSSPTSKPTPYIICVYIRSSLLTKERLRNVYYIWHPRSRGISLHFSTYIQIQPY